MNNVAVIITLDSIKTRSVYFHSLSFLEAENLLHVLLFCLY